MPNPLLHPFPVLPKTPRSDEDDVDHPRSSSRSNKRARKTQKALRSTVAPSAELDLPALSAAMKRISALESTVQKTLETVSRQQAVISDLQGKHGPIVVIPDAEPAANTSPVRETTPAAAQQEEEVQAGVATPRRELRRRPWKKIMDQQALWPVDSVSQAPVAGPSTPVRPARDVPPSQPRSGVAAVASSRRDKASRPAGTKRRDPPSGPLASSPTAADPYIQDKSLFGPLPIEYHPGFRFYYCNACNIPVQNIEAHLRKTGRSAVNQKYGRNHEGVQASLHRLEAIKSRYPEGDPYDYLSPSLSVDNPHPAHIPYIFTADGYACRFCSHYGVTLHGVIKHCKSEHDESTPTFLRPSDPRPFVACPNLQSFAVSRPWFPSSPLPKGPSSSSIRPPRTPTTRARVQLQAPSSAHQAPSSSPHHRSTERNLGTGQFKRNDRPHPSPTQPQTRSHVTTAKAGTGSGPQRRAGAPIVYVQIDPRARPIVIADSPEDEEGHIFTLEEDGVEIIDRLQKGKRKRDDGRGYSEASASIARAGFGGLFGMQEYGSDMDEEEQEERAGDDELLEEEEEEDDEE